MVVNQRSGRGAGAAAAAALARAALRQGWQAEVIQVQDAGGHDWHATQRAVIVGGDGTVHHALGWLRDAGVPMVVFPTGTENLLARELGHRADVRQTLALLAEGAERAIDLASVERADGERLRTSGVEGALDDEHNTDVAGASPRLWALMLSIGPDAGVVHRLARARHGAITHASYLGPIVGEWFAPSLGPVRVRVDGRWVVGTAGHDGAGQLGVLLVANCSAYALGINPAAGARSDDGMLDVVFLPAKTAAGVVAWGLWGLAGCIGEQGEAVVARGGRVEVFAPGLPSQVDGEALAARTGNLVIRVQPGALRVLVCGQERGA